MVPVNLCCRIRRVYTATMPQKQAERRLTCTLPGRCARGIVRRQTAKGRKKGTAAHEFHGR
jgi:hypothetical protein